MDAVHKRDKVCQFARFFPEDSSRCSGLLDVHEPANRRNVDFTDPAFCVLLCRAHHDWVGRNIARAEAVGLYQRGNGFPLRKGLQS